MLFRMDSKKTVYYGLERLILLVSPSNHVTVLIYLRLSFSRKVHSQTDQKEQSFGEAEGGDRVMNVHV